MAVRSNQYVRHFLGVTLTVGAGMLFAGVPHTFKAGDPARADEVNQNFSHLDGRLGVLEAAKNNTAPPITYTKKDVVPGTSVTMGASPAPYSIFRVPVYDEANDIIYAVKLPLYSTHSLGNVEYYVLPAPEQFEGTFEVDGYPARLASDTEYLNRPYTVYGISKHDNSPTRLIMSSASWMSVEIRIDQVVLVIRRQYDYLSGGYKDGSVGSYDLVDLLDKTGPRTKDVWAVWDDYIDYIVIEGKI